MALMKQAVIPEFFARLKKAMPEPKTELEYDNVYQLLVSVVLSAQATDIGVNRATTPLFKIIKTPAQMVALGERKLIRLHQDDRPVPHEGQERHQAEPAADREARRRGAAHPRGASGIARRRPQDRQRGDERGFRRGDHRRRHAYLPRRQPHRPGARQEPARGRAEAVEARARGISPARPPLADPARPLHLQGAQARMPALRGERPLPVQGQRRRSSSGRGC